MAISIPIKPIAVVGAGITGLTAAFYLQRRGLPVIVYEAANHAGGIIQSTRMGGFLAEFGPNTILETSPEIAQLVRDAGLESRKLAPRQTAEARYIVRGKRPVAMPSSFAGFLKSPLFTWRAKLGLLREPFRAPRRDGKEESVAEFVIRRLGREFLDHAIDPLVAGIYAGDPYRLSTKEAFPKLTQLEARYGSLIKGLFFGARERSKRREVSKDRAPKFSFDDGLQVLPETLRERLGSGLMLSTKVTKVNETIDGWDLDLRQGNNETHAEHSAVIFAGTAFSLANLKIVAKSELGLASLSEVRYPPVASVVLGFRREDVEHSCEGFGMLIPRTEGFKILGTIFSSSLFPNRAPAGHVTLTSYVGGERSPELAGLPSDQLFNLVCEDLKVLLGVRDKPTFKHAAYFEKAIPQYNLGYCRFRELMTESEAKAPGLFFAGHYRDGVSLGDCIVSGIKASERVQAYCNEGIRGGPPQHQQMAFKT